jgi:hypothetical protein
MKTSNRIGIGAGQGRGYKNLIPYDSHVHYLAGKGVTIYQPVFAKQKLTHLPLELTLFVPSTKRDEPISVSQFKKIVQDAEKEMGKLFGGYTRTNTQGGWVDAGGELIEEPIATVTSFTTVENFEKGKAQFEQYVKQIRKKYNQDAISIEFEGDLYFYEPSAKKPEGTPEFIEGGMSSGMSNSDFNKKQLAMGVKVEMEHTTNPKIAREIARDHLAEIPDYYTRLAKMEDTYKPKYKHGKKDTDRDGVPDAKDCKPFDAARQDMFVSTHFQLPTPLKTYMKKSFPFAENND